MFLPTTKQELKDLGWSELDIILVSGDSYIDSPFIGVAVIGKVLLDAGFKVGVIAQPDVNTAEDITRLGEPRLFWGITGGCIDSMIANRTASGKPRKNDDYTPGGKNNRRPDRAIIKYSNLIRRHFKNTAPLVLGGLEASLRRIAHYDFWSDKIRKSVLFDAKADFLLYGMAERSVIDLAHAIKNLQDPKSIKGLCYISKEFPDGYIELPSYQQSSTDKKAFIDMFNLFYQNNDPVTAQGLAQLHDNRFLIQNPPADYLNTSELDHVYGLDFERDLHPYYAGDGKVKALETIRFSLTTHRGCYGECNFCAITVHQGRTVRWRSQKSILAEARKLTEHPRFKGIIYDVGGPTANMYGIECTQKTSKAKCKDKRCLFPEVCKNLDLNHQHQIKLLSELRKIPKVKKVFVASGIRYDMILAASENGEKYLQNLINHHISGQFKVAPEHSEAEVLELMGKPDQNSLLEFQKLFNKLNSTSGKKQFMTYYLIAGHPGCRQEDMDNLAKFFQKNFKIIPRQVQIFTPTPSTYSSLMYWTGENPFNLEPCFVEKSFKGREKQKNTIQKPAFSKSKNHQAESRRK